MDFQTITFAMQSINVLIVDDEVNIRKTLTVFMESRGHRVKAVSNSRDAMSEAELQVFDLAFVDLRLGADNGIDLVPLLSTACPWIKIVVITAYASVETAVEAMKRGAADFIAKPFTPDQLQLVTERLAAVCEMEKRIALLQEDLNRFQPQVYLTSRYPSMQRAMELARKVASSDAVVLLKGAGGTGKNVLARSMHAWSPRAVKPFAIISCSLSSPEQIESELFGHAKGSFSGALRESPGKIAGCEGGTLLLDEIGDLPLSLQPKLLRFLQDREYERIGENHTRRADVRIIAATNVELERAVRDGRFREELLYLLNVIQIDLPKLSGRPDDVEQLAVNMLRFFAAQNHKHLEGFTAGALLALRNHSWPGNIRELRNVIERAVILSTTDLVGEEVLPETMIIKTHPVRLGDPLTLEVIEENHIRRILASTKSLQEAADLLGIDQATLWRKRKQYGI